MRYLGGLGRAKIGVRGWGVWGTESVFLGGEMRGPRNPTTRRGGAKFRGAAAFSVGAGGGGEGGPFLPAPWGAFWAWVAVAGAFRGASCRMHIR